MNEYELSAGPHQSPSNGRCAMEWVAYLAGEPHSDQPACVSPFLRRLFVIANDCLWDEDRQKLRPFLARTIGTKGDGLDEFRYQAVVEWLCSPFTGLRERFGDAPRRALHQHRTPRMTIHVNHVEVCQETMIWNYVDSVLQTMNPYGPPGRLEGFLKLLDELLPTEPLELPVVEDAAEVCAAP